MGAFLPLDPWHSNKFRCWFFYVFRSRHGYLDPPSREGLYGVGIKKPGREMLQARLVVPHGELAAIPTVLETQRSIDRPDLVELKDSSGTASVTMEKLIYIRKR
jgi:hypothetical protein